MRPIFVLVFAALFTSMASAADAPDAHDEAPEAAQSAPEALPDPDLELVFADARDVDVRDFIWTRRIIVVMADTNDDPQFDRQIEALRARADEFVDRDAVVIFDAHPDDRSPLRQVLRPRGFMTAIIDKDGEVKARRPAYRTARELMAVIDRFPTRRQEILERLPSGR